MNKTDILGEFIYRTNDVYELNRWNNCPQAIPDNATLRRYLTRCEWDVDYAEKLYRKMLEWRVINNIDRMVGKIEYPNSIEDEGGVYLAPFNHEFLDYYGIPIEIVKMSKITFANADIDDILNYFILKEETLLRKYDISDKSMILIYDFNNFSMTLSFVLNILPKLSKISHVMDDYYAGRARKIYIINVPPLFETFYKLGSNFIPEHTTRIINIYPTSNCSSTCDTFDKASEFCVGSNFKQSEFIGKIIYDTPDHAALLKYLRNS